MQSEYPRFSIVIVNWNTRDLTIAAIASVYAVDDRYVEIIVVDNASQDDSAEAIRRQFPNVVLIQNDENLGFSKANNIGIRKARGEFIVLLNSDAEIKSKDALNKLEHTFRANKDVGILGGKLFRPNGSLESLGRSFLTLKELVKMQLFFRMAFPKNRKAEHYKLIYVDYVAVAFLAVRKTVIEEIGLLNEAFFMYGEDMEWCARAHDYGWRIAVMPEVEVMHHHAASSVKNFRKVLVENAINTCRFMWWKYGAHEAKVAFYIYLLGMAIRIPLSMIRCNGLSCDYAFAFAQGLKILSNLQEKLRYD